MSNVSLNISMQTVQAACNQAEPGHASCECERFYLPLCISYCGHNMSHTSHRVQIYKNIVKKPENTTFVTVDHGRVSQSLDS